MTFSTPLALLLLLSLPYFFWLGRPGRGGRRRWRDWAGVGLRLLIVLLLVLSLAGAQVVRAADELAVVFLIDASDSITPQQAEQAEAFVREAMATMGPTDQAAVVVFGANALVERPMSGLAALAPITSVPQTLHTDIAEAIRLGLALFPAGSGRRLVILSDGAATIGDAREAARLAAASSVQIDVILLPRPAESVEAWLTNVQAPGRISQGETFRLEVTAESTGNLAATLRVLGSGAVVHEETVQLRPGSNNFIVRLRASEQEFARYSVQLVPTEDTYYQNNQLAAFTEITGPPRILLVASDGTLDDEGNPIPDESPQLRLALEAAGLTVDRVTPADFPTNLEGLAGYDAVVLVNVNAKYLTPRKMETLQSYVRDLGGGLAAVGGPESYGMGGYFRTPLEEALPVNMQITDQERFPSVSIVIVIDRSGSMAVQEGGVTKIQLAAEGAVRVVELLHDFDEITVIPVDERPDNPIGPLPASERDLAISRIRQMGAGGGGIFVRAGLEAAAEALVQSPNHVKHIILLADGADAEQKEGAPELIEALAAEGVTVSVVSIGNGPDVPWLQAMAELGGGRFHFTDRAANLPQIFTQETTSIQRSYLIEERFFPTLGSQSAILSGIRAVPPLYGYVGTSAKETAQTILTTHLGDPLLAVWQYGLGRSLAWTSDATGRWAADWVRWQGFAPFWAQAVRWTIAQDRQRNVETAVTLDGETARLTVDARASDGAFLNDLTLQANVVPPGGEPVSVTLAQVAPGRYEGAFTPAQEGAYFIGVAGSDAAGEVSVGQTSGWVLGYSPEYLRLEADPQLLASLAELTGGRQLDLTPAEGEAAGGAAQVFSHDLSGERIARPIWTWLTLAAVVLLPLDVALRRLALTRRDWQRLWAATFGRMVVQPIPSAGRTEQVARLFEAKQRAGATTERELETAEPPPILRRDATEETRPTAEPTHEPTPGETAAEPGTLAARLLEKKRGQGKALDNDKDQG